MKPYVVISDLHYHAWSAFAETNAQGVNTRLQMILDATREAAEAVRAAGGNHIFIAGDVFHKRGEIAPSVLNPVMDLYRDLIAQGYEIHAIPGNHDLERNDSERLANSITALESLGVHVYHEPTAVKLDDSHYVGMFPWFSSIDALLRQMLDMRDELTFDDREFDAEAHIDAIIHAPVDGVLPHLPSHGLNADDLQGTGWNRVFSGHYHNYADLGEGVYSIGALTHQNWGDIGAIAGYLLITDEETVEQRETKHPKFVELTGDESDEDAERKVRGNYVRVRVQIEKDSEIKEIRDGVMAMGALGCTVMPMKKTTVTRAGTAASSTAPTSVRIEQSIKSYLEGKKASARAHTIALDILNEARAA